MKYCTKCGTLLEDSQNRCIGCGQDVTEPGTWSLYPPEMAASMAQEKEEDKSRTKMIIAMVVVFILLVVAIAVFIVANAKRIQEAEPINPTKESAEVSEPEVNEIAQDVALEIAEEEEENLGTLELPEADKSEDAESSDGAGDKEIRDANGKYYTLGSVSDLAGNTMLTSIYPEDFEEKTAGINYEVYSTRFPESITYIVSNKDGNAKFTYMSPQHFWYRKSDNKSQTRSNERDVEDYMQFLTYGGAQSYIEALIKQSYSDLKGFKLVSTEELSPDITAVIEKISNDRTAELLVDTTTDHAKIAKDTVYAAMQAEFEAAVYHYEATSRQGNTIFMDYYVPVVANTLGYVSDSESDKGEVTEWIVPEFVAFEAGNEELYNLYKDAFNIFIYNTRPTNEFFYINHEYSNVIEEAVKVRRQPYKLSSEKLKTLAASYKPGADIGEFAKGISTLLNSAPSNTTSFSGDINISAVAGAKVGFYSKEKNKVFISPSEDEYPGSDYVQLDYHESSSSESSDSSASVE